MLIKQLDLIENLECRRYSSSAEEKAAQEAVRSEVLKLVPENYRLAILPAQFTYTDGERIRRMMGDMAQEFMLNSSSASKSDGTNKKIMFAIGAKIYPFHNQINSVRVVLIRMMPLNPQEVKRLQRDNTSNT